VAYSSAPEMESGGSPKTPVSTHYTTWSHSKKIFIGAIVSKFCIYDPNISAC
jgi:hypothetical protein